MTNKQVIPDCQQGNPGLSPQDVLRGRVASAITQAVLGRGKLSGTETALVCADAAIAAVYDALLEMELPYEAKTEAKIVNLKTPGSDCFMLGSQAQEMFRAVIRSLANQGGK